MKIYVLFNGSYSDTHVVGVFSSEENARLAAGIFQDCASVEEFETDSAVAEMRKGFRPYFVRLDRHSGNELECHIQDSSYGALDRSTREDVHKNLYTNCFAANDAHAVKIASDRRRAFLACEPLPADAEPS